LSTGGEPVSYDSVRLGDCDLSNLSEKQCDTFFIEKKVLLNKNEFDNFLDHFGNGDGSYNMSACLALLSEAPASASGHFYQSTSTSPLRNSAGAHTGRWSRQAPPPVEHSSASSLAPMGTSHLGSGAQYKAFPAHWGEPPNSPMKGHHGVIRDLPNGYGRGNAALERWVKEKIEADERAGTNELGEKRYPFGNYSM